MPSASANFGVTLSIAGGGVFDIGSIPAAGNTEWPTGRLSHPSLGPYDYMYAPAGWSGYLLEAYKKPIWAVERTFTGAAHTLWPPLLPDTIVAEYWTGLPLEQLRALITMAANPTNVRAGEFITWAPTYATNETYPVIMFDVRCGSIQGASPSIVFDAVAYYAQGGWVTDPVEVFYQIADPETTAGP